MAAYEMVGSENIVIEPVSRSQIEYRFRILPVAGPSITRADGSYPGIIIDPLLVVLERYAEQLQDIGEVDLDLISSTVAENDNILAHL